MPARRQLSHNHTLGIGRREVLQVGYSGLLGAGLPAILSQQAQAAKAKGSTTDQPKRPKSVLIVFLTGAPSHHDTFDMKPDAPVEIRGEFKPIATSVPGVHFSEHIPQLAKRSDKYAVIRTLSHSDNNHLMSTHHLLTGNKQPGAFFDKVASRDDWPCYSSACSYLRPRRDGIPSGVNLPTFLLQGPLTWPGQHAGFLGPKYDPWQITGDPNKKDFRVESLTLASGIDVSRLEKRQELLAEVNRQQQRIGEVAEARRLSDDQQLAFSILTSSKLAQAFQLNRESDAMRDRYGRHTTGQSLLLARRLVQVGVPVVQTNIGRVQNWDSHGNIFPTLKNRLLPPLDQGVAALLDDMESLGLLDETLVVMLGEFGRTPKINKGKGRDHWGPCFFGLFAGAGVQGGQVIGKSDAIGAYPVTRAYSPNDVGATIYGALGIPAEAVVRDRLNRPARLNTGTVIEPLYTGAAS
ncbi:MAG: DUF1501 domain-containing protein [Planctomycetaceae bacterium]|jgi:hypothetical protein|nr:DUF1501 domain-containing protein [Planctomycetaceae bacterium]MBT6486965.1 DUF1501 domain-containing protein [Planctomycetaceae bacterium]MBT6492997.1 DUF1501 domain-containing protein [Planctomycetaceae bacterium]